jgi:uncharacterized protein (DUF1501 family)
MEHGLDRRVLLRGMGAAGTLALARPFRPLPGLGADEDDRVLVLVQLGGGNDGLSTVVPHGDDAYGATRKSIRIDAADVLPIDEYRGLNPRLERLHARFQEGGLAIVEGVGYPEPNRSHFRSYEVWHTADARGRASGEGWIGRLCERAFGSDVQPNRVVHVGGKVPYSVYSTRHPASAFTTPAGYRWVKKDEELADLDPGEERPDAPADDDALAFLRGKMREARASSADLRSAAVRYETPVEYPRGRFADDLHAAAALVNGGVGVRVVSVELTGFDTHNDQRRRHELLMETLDGGLAAFLDDLERTEVGRRALVLVFSEFGRRVAENGSRGTDHGCAGPMFVAGAHVKGGLFGEHPSLTELDAGDLVYTTDFRSVYAAAIEGCFDVAARDVLGASYPALPLLA